MMPTAAEAAKPELAGKTVPSDQSKDGKMDHWETYDSRGVKVLIASDTNQDGRPDYWKHPIHAMNILREKDRNYDGRIDQRQATDFIYDKVLKFQRHLYVWIESDDNFDGVIDVYRVRGVREPSPNRIGQKIDQTPWSSAKEAKIAVEKRKAAAEKTRAGEQVKQMNARQSMAGH